MPRINVLSTHLVNKIAAGEVIERPASVVKEFVENSLDAGARRVEITVEDGGRKLISVADDGVGMPPEDLSLAFVPHATSKLSSDEDLFNIATMGFRGEALASIAAISHATIRTRPRDAQGEDAHNGWEIEASGQNLGEIRPCAASAGTTITVRDLFFNTPARRKFMRTPGTEFGHIVEQLARVALPRPHVAFRLIHNGRETHNLPATDSTRQRARDLFGPELADGLLPLKGRTGPVGVQGFVGPPSIARSSSKWQYFFLNGRYIRDRLLSHALREAYRGRLDSSRSPVALVFLEVDPAEVDVNVHPTKIEVRFRESQAVHGAVMGSLKETLNRTEPSPEASFTGSDASDKLPAGAVEALKPEDADEDDTRRQSLQEALADFFKAAPRPQPKFDFQPGESGGYRSTNRAASAESGALPIERATRPYPASDPPRQPIRTPAPRPQAEDLPPARPAETEQAPAQQPPPLRPLSALPLMQVHNSYIVAQTDEGLMIVDQHALHERIRYNELSARLAGGGLSGQRLLIPQTLRVSTAEEQLLLDHRELLAGLGVEVEPFGPSTVAIQQFPTLLTERGVEPGDFLRELLDELSDDDTADAERLLENVLAMMACKSAVKAGDPLSLEEMADLLARSDGLDKRSSCPHGRPTTLTLSLRDLEKQFHRG